VLSEGKVSGDHCRCFSAGATLEAILAFVGTGSQSKTKRKTKQKSSECSGALNCITCVCLTPKLQCHFCTVLVIITYVHQEVCLLQRIPMNPEWHAAYFPVLSKESNITFIPFGLMSLYFPPCLRWDKNRRRKFVLKSVDFINNKMLARKAIYVRKHQTTRLLCTSVITLGKITVTQPTPLSLVVLVSCFNNINLTVLILIHNVIMIPRTVALRNRSGRYKILPTSRLNHPHHIFVVVWKLAHYELVYLEALVWESSNTLSP